MLFGFLLFLFVLLCILLTFLILLQKSKSSLGAVYTGGSTQMLFGGSGGQDLFQKITWIFGAFFMGGSLALAIMKRPSGQLIRSLATQQTTSQAKQAAQNTVNQ